MLYPKLNPEHTAYGWFKIDTLDSFSEKIDPKVVKSVIKCKKKRKKMKRKLLLLSLLLLPAFCLSKNVLYFNNGKF